MSGKEKGGEAATKAGKAQKSTRATEEAAQEQEPNPPTHKAKKQTHTRHWNSGAQFLKDPWYRRPLHQLDPPAAVDLGGLAT